MTEEVWRMILLVCGGGCCLGTGVAILLVSLTTLSGQWSKWTGTQGE